MYYQRHIFFCTNQKCTANGCGDISGDSGFVFTKLYLQSLDLWGEGKFRASKSGCLGRCSDGPICVIYPDGIWYNYIDENDIKEIIDEHLIKGDLVQRLALETFY